MRLKLIVQGQMIEHMCRKWRGGLKWQRYRGNSEV